MTIIGDVQLSEPMESIYIEQEDALFAQLTTLETLQTSAELRTNLSPEERARDINNLINDLGLKKVKNTKVGDTKTRGLSGGEKKRLSIANELIDKKAENALIFADEPTSGLDCFQAEKVVNLLKKLADQNNVVLFSIHQPRSSIYAMFDDITILSEGKVIYTGSREEMLPYFESIGHPCPSYANPAEYYVDLVSLDLTSPEEETSSRERIDKLAETFASKYAEKFNKAITSLGSKAISMNDNSNSKLVAQKIKPKTNPFKNILSTVANSWRKLRILHQRAWRQITRDKPLNIARFASSMFSALLFGAIYFRMGTGAATVPDRLGLLQVAAVVSMITTIV